MFRFSQHEKRQAQNETGMEFVLKGIYTIPSGCFGRCLQKFINEINTAIADHGNLANISCQITYAGLNKTFTSLDFKFLQTVQQG